ncbi:hypothetical protein [Vibrio phage RYC]|nr:hypothetical protein [Vibrio phage RYC]
MATIVMTICEAFSTSGVDFGIEYAGAVIVDCMIVIGGYITYCETRG